MADADSSACRRGRAQLIAWVLGLLVLLSGVPGIAAAQESTTRDPSDSRGAAGAPGQVPLSAPVVVPESVVVPPPRQMELLPPAQTIKKRRMELAAAGIGMFLVVWVADRLLTQDLSASKPTSWIPLAGPWILLDEQVHLPLQNDLTTALLVLDGVAQLVGVTLTVLGFVLHKERVVLALPPRASLHLGGPGLALSF